MTSHFDSVDAFPAKHNFRDSSLHGRPSVLSLIQKGGQERNPHRSLQARIQQEGRRQSLQSSMKRFGTFDGVISRVLLNMWGAILFLRLSFLVGNAGLLLSLGIVLFALLLTLVTCTSLSAIATNGEISGGGPYYLLSRHFDSGYGATVGVAFAFANAISVALYLVAFAEAVELILPDDFDLVSGFDLRLYALAALAILFSLAMFGVAWVVKIDLALLVILVLGILLVFLGGFINGSSEADGITGIKIDTLSDNLYSEYDSGESLISVFAVFFPAMTGMMAGVNISGDLKRPEHSIPAGTIYGVLITTSVYLLLVLLLGSAVERQTLLDDPLTLVNLSLFRPMVIAALFASTLSSGMASLVAGPKIFTAVCQDGIFPAFSFFAKVRQSDKEPIRAYFLVGAVAVGFILIGSLNQIASFITLIFLLTRSSIDFACFYAHFSRSPGWRPSFKHYSPIVSLLFSIIGVAVMFAVSWYFALATFAMTFLLYYFAQKRRHTVNWGTAVQGMVYKNAQRSHMTAEHAQPHVKTWVPSFLVAAKDAKDQRVLLQLVRHFSQNGLTVLVDAIPGELSLLWQTVLSRKAAWKSGLFRQRHPAVAEELPVEEVILEVELPTVVEVEESKLETGDIDEALLDVCAAVDALPVCTVAETWVDAVESTMKHNALGAIGPNMLMLKLGAASDRDLLHLINCAMWLKMGVVLVADAIRIPAERPLRISIFWLVDSGGHSVLLPHLLCSKNQVITLHIHSHDVAELVPMMAAFRIPISDVEAHDFHSPPDPDFLCRAEAALHLSRLDAKSLRMLRVAEEIGLEAGKADPPDLVCVTLPFPPDDQQAEVFAKWLKCLLFRVAAPVLLIRGTQENVLTFRA